MGIEDLGPRHVPELDVVDGMAFLLQDAEGEGNILGGEGGAVGKLGLRPQVEGR
jgi:hypothetical protein